MTSMFSVIRQHHSKVFTAICVFRWPVTVFYNITFSFLYLFFVSVLGGTLFSEYGLSMNSTQSDMKDSTKYSNPYWYIFVYLFFQVFVFIYVFFLFISFSTLICIWLEIPGPHGMQYVSPCGLCGDWLESEITCYDAEHKINTVRERTLLIITYYYCMHHDANFIVAGGTRGCHYDNL